MQKPLFWILIFMIIGVSCSTQPASNKLENTFWTTEILYDKERNEFTPNMIFSFGSDTASVHQFGTGKKLFELPYSIRNNKLYLDGKANPFLKFLKMDKEKIIASLGPEDTTILKKVYPKNNIEKAIRSELLNQSFVFKRDGTDKNMILYFEEKEVLQFSKDIENEDSKFVNFNFSRVPYSIDFTNGIPTIIIGNLSTASMESSLNGAYNSLNIIIGKVNRKEENKFEISSFFPNEVKKSALIKVDNRNIQTRLTDGEWKRGSNLIFRFEPDGKLRITEKGTKRELTWKTDNSGYLIIMEEKSGERLYAIKNFNLHEKRIGLEFARGKFGDILNLN